MKKPTVFISYSHKDEEWKDLLVTHLRVLERLGQLAVWDDRSIDGGAKGYAEIQQAMEAASVAILLISVHYLNSSVILNEVAPKQAESQGVRLIPLILSPCAWQEVSWLASRQVLPQNGRPLSTLSEDEIDEQLVELAMDVADFLKRSSDEPSPSSTEDPADRLESRPPPPEEVVKEKTGPQRDESATSMDREETTKGQDESVPTHFDEPATLDELGRRPFADVVAMRMDELWGLNQTAGVSSKSSKQRQTAAFTFHIHGPWGSGKSSILNLLREELTSNDRPNPWIVVEFNAWRNQRINPPWWALIREVYNQGRAQLRKRRNRWAVDFSWLVWRLKADWLPLPFALAGVAVVVWLLFLALEGFSSGNEAKNPGDFLATAFKILTALLAGVTAFIAASRTLLFGSSQAAKTYLALSRDPLGPITALFQKLVRRLRRPLAVFVDDLDRCRPEYLVDLLEGIQTLFKGVGVAYVVAADRSWIRLSFEQRYESFSKSIAEPGRPLGYLFMEKLFQVSVSVPRLSRAAQREYWDRLLDLTTEEIEGEVDKAREEARKLLRNTPKTEAALREAVSGYEGDNPLVEKELSALAARLISKRDAQKATEHQLQPFSHLVERNPRAMKRLLNAYGFHQVLSILEGRGVESGPLTLWTIIELRWPLLADYLAKRPDLVEKIGVDLSGEHGIPEELVPLFNSSAVKKVVDGDGVAGAPSLTKCTIRSIVGLEQLEDTGGLR